MHRFLERLDGAASTIVPVAYLAGLALGTMAYFTGVTLDAGLAVGVALALAAELHSFLEQRRCRALWASYNRASDEDVRDRLAGQIKAHVAILAALVAFSAVNATAFAAETWHPAPGFLPTWLQIGIRGAVVPCLFLLTGALSPLTVNASDELAAASRHMLHRTIKATVKQWNARIERARKHGLDLAPVAVSLMLDAGDVDGARRVQLIAEGLDIAESGRVNTPALSAPAPLVHPTALQDASQPSETAHGVASASRETDGATAPTEPHTTPSVPRPRPPTGGGTPRRNASKRSRRVPATPPAILRLPAERRVAAIIEQDPDVSIRQLAKRAHVAQSSASKWREVYRQAAAMRASEDAAGEVAQ